MKSLFSYGSVSVDETPFYDDYIINFRKESYEKRKKNAKKMLDKYDNRVPLIVGSQIKDKNIVLRQRKFLVPTDLTVGQFNYVLRKKISGINPSNAIFVYFDNNLVKTSDTIGIIYDRYKSDDDFLYSVVCTENTFG